VTSRTGSATLRPGRLFRSSEQRRVDDEGRATLRWRGITDVADLCASWEVARRGPGLVPDGTEIHLLPFPDPGEDESDADDQGPHERAFQRLLTGEGGGPDTSVDEGATRYMTDEYRQFPTRNGAQRALQLRVRISEMIARRQETELTPEVVTFTEARLSDGVLGVREEYLAAARQTIDETFGSLDGYLRDAGITVADVDRLRSALLA
jgi:protein-tyrosine phosphatase